MKTYSDWVINWCWYVDVEINVDESVTILAHYRRHGNRDIHPESVGNYRIIENAERFAVQIRLDGVARTVANPKHVFDYGEPK